MLKIDERAQCSLFFLSFKDVTLKYDEKIVLNNINFNVTYNQLILLKGRIGSGKSSILKLIAGIYLPTSGIITNRTRLGTPIKSIFIHGQSEFNFVTGYVRDELTFAGIEHNKFQHLKNRCVSELSGGELKKLSIMIAIERMKDKNSIIIIDEPLDMLDDLEAEYISNIIINSSKFKPFIIATHDDHFDNYADYILNIGY